MKLIKQYILPLFFCIVCIACSEDDSANSEMPADQVIFDFRQELNVAYGTDPRQVFDIYLPEGRTQSTKVMILIHGGGWVSGSKEDMNLLKDLYLQDAPDIAIVNMNYRLANEDNPPYPMQINDISLLIDYLKSNKETFVISDDIGFLGTSAGAHLAMLWSYAFDTESNVQMVCSIVGPTNFTDPAYLENEDPVIDELIEIYGIDPTTDFLEEVSPFHQVNESAPPTILFYGGQDPLIPTSQGVDMSNRLEALGVTHEFTLYENAGHGWIGLELIDTWNKIKVFTNSHL